ncbi:MAG: DoxX family protein [Bacteroidota bacterium]|nr:DoxX family protein [Bacteroidota bacterium]
MKLLVNIARVFVGILFIFSGLVKANDPLGLSFKMQEFFEVWASNSSLTSTMHLLSDFALPFSIIMITLEVIVGIGLLLGLWKKFFTWLLLLLIIFFSFLTGYAALSGKISTCGCFGDCIPLTSMQSFLKDLVLLALIILIFFGRKHIVPILKPVINFFVFLVSGILVLVFQWYVMRHLPIVDCLPYKIGNNILELRKMPADAVPDKKDYKFIYQKNGEKHEFTVKDLPDSSWEFVSREDFIVQKGKNNEPPVKDFYLTTLSGNDSTSAILGVDAEYYLFFVKDVSLETDSWLSNFTSLYKLAKNKNRAIYIISPQAVEADQFFNQQNNYGIPVFNLDATAFKTAARTYPELYLLKGPVIENKWSWADLKKALK